MPYDKSILQEILLESDCRTLDETGKPYPPSNKVYGIIADRMQQRGSDIKGRHIYTIINENRNGFKVLIEQKYDINTKFDNKCISNNSTFSVSTDTSLNVSESECSKKVRLIISAKQWLKMAPKKKISGGRIYWKLQEGWTDIIAERICQQHKVIDCVFSFKNNIVTPRATAQYYAKFIGSCIECNASITGILLTPPKNDVDVIFSCKIENIKASMHVGCKKRQLRGQRREKIAIKMIEQRKDAVTFRREEARRLKKFGGKNIPILPNTTVLRKAKEQQLLKMHGLEFANPLINLTYYINQSAGNMRALYTVLDY